MRFAAVLVLLLAFACSTNKPSSTEPPTSSATSSPAATLCSVPGTTATKTATASGSPVPVTDVRYSDDGCAKVVFQFSRTKTPGYQVGYVSPPFQDCGSGADIATSTWGSSAYLQIRLAPSGGVDLSKGPNPTYTGPRDISVDKATLKHLKVSCDFEGVFTWIAGLDAKHPFTVQTMQSPPRIVVNIASAK